MSNRSNNAPYAAPDARRVIAAPLRERAREVPPAAFDEAGFDTAARLGVAGGSPDLRLTAMHRLLCPSPARSAELRGLWNESVVTAAFASTARSGVGGATP